MIFTAQHEGERIEVGDVTDEPGKVAIVYRRFRHEADEPMPEPVRMVMSLEALDNMRAMAAVYMSRIVIEEAGEDEEEERAL